MNSALKTKLLNTIYPVYESFVDSSSFACRKGCSSCCTQSVTLTALEGTIILEYVHQRNTDALIRLAGKLAGASPSTPSCTTNQFARACLEGKETANEPGTWSFAPCIFLSDRSCSIYPVRPFGCRSFVSTICCDKKGTAQLPTEFISLNSAVMQIIEHIDQGNIWGNMIDVLRFLLESRSVPKKGASLTSSGMLLSQPSPGLLLPPEDEKYVSVFLTILYDKKVEDKSFGQWLSTVS